jgi:hypothetical protein
MKRFALITLLYLIFQSSNFGQELKESNSTDKKKSSDLTVDYDSIWCFHPFSADFSAGLYMPIGKLSDFIKPSFQVGLGLGIMVSNKSRIQLGIYPRFIRSNSSFLVNHKDTILFAEPDISGSLGGWISHEIYKDKLFYTELIAGISWEPFDAVVRYPAVNIANDSINISTLGFSLGLNTWINTFGAHNVGLKVMYQFAAYDKAEILVDHLGGHSLSITLVYRFSKRSVLNRKYYY